MRKWMFSSIAAAGLCLGAARCTNQPGTPTVTFTSPQASGPASGFSYKFKDQPITLVITNAVRTASATVTYAVEVAADAAFTQKVFARDGIPEGGGMTSVTISSLPASSGDVTYYWRSTATIDGVASQPTATRSFVVQQQIVVNAPVLSAPANASTTTEVRPTFVVRNATRQGAVGAITYKFQVSRESEFSSLLFDATVPEASGGLTSWTPGSDLPAGTIYWRVQARDDANGEASGFATPRSLVVEEFDVRKAVFWANPAGIADWPQTARITSVDFSTGYVLVDFDRRMGPNPWPETGNAFFGPIQYTLGMCFRLSGQWHCSAPTRFWVGRDLEASGPASEIADNWYYDPARWGPMAGHQPAQGELIAIWVGQGNLRDVANGARINERSNFAMVRFGQNYRAQ